MMTVKRSVHNKSTSKSDLVAPKIRIREGMRQQLRKAADANLRSLNAEIVLRLQRSLLQPEPAE